jgi:2'-5' RNA ligase
MNYILVLLVEDLPNGAEIDIWPPHVTILPWFSSELGHEETLEYLERSFERTDFKPVDTAVLDEKMFGNRNNIPVDLVELTPELKQLHLSCLNLMKKPLKLESGNFTGQNFKPHITKRRPSNLKNGQTLVFDKLYLVTADEKRKNKTVAAVYPL